MVKDIPIEERSDSVTYTISGIELYTHIGISEEERREKRRVELDINIDTDKFIDLKEIYNLVRDSVEGASYVLIEDIGRELLSILDSRCGCTRLTIRVRKPNPPIGGKVDYIECKMEFQQEFGK
ncbi:dihydroneopterin aldolase [candidate division WOR-3 bacterium]|nr:dihydroneopterin aldolase [candidate division WOR-3 bacterium]